MGPIYEKGRKLLHEIRKICRESDVQDASDAKDALQKIEVVTEKGLERHLLLKSPEDVVLSFMMVVSIMAAFLFGHAHRSLDRRQWWAGLLFATVVASTLCLISDYASPRVGVIRVDIEDVVYEDLG